jgi:hypothetical protein
VEPRSVSFVTLAGLMSTQITLQLAGNRFPTAIEWSSVQTMSAMPMVGTCSRIARCASTTSVITSGNGPSSRIEPARTTGIFFV